MTTRGEEIAAEGPYRADHENGFSVVRDLSAPEGSKIMMMMPEPMKWFADRMNEAHANGYKQGQQDRWISVETPPTDWAERPRKFLLLTLMPITLRMTDNVDDAFDTLQGWWRGKGWILEANPTPGMEPRIVGWMELPPFVLPALPSPPNH